MSYHFTQVSLFSFAQMSSFFCANVLRFLRKCPPPINLCKCVAKMSAMAIFCGTLIKSSYFFSRLTSKPRIYVSHKMPFFLQPRKLIPTKINESTVSGYGPQHKLLLQKNFSFVSLSL